MLFNLFFILSCIECKTVVEFVKFWNNEASLKSIPDAVTQRILKEKAVEIKQHFILHRWLEKNDLLELEKV